MQGKHKPVVPPACLGAIFLAVTAAAAAAADAVTAGELIVDRPTLHNLAFRWLIEGDANFNAAVAVEYAPSGTDGWRPAQPLLRLGGGRLNAFAGSVLDLEPATAYDVRFAMTDPDGGGETRTLTVTTRPQPPDLPDLQGAGGRRRLHVYPSGFEGRRAEPLFETLRQAFTEAVPGDVVLVHGGVYQGPFEVTASGTAENPVFFVAAGDGEAVIDGAGSDQGAVNGAEGSDYIGFYGMTVRNAHTGILATQSDGWIVRRCRIHDVGRTAVHTGLRDWYVADNVLVGPWDQWRERKGGIGFGVRMYGAGHVVTHNDISWFWDGVSTFRRGSGAPHWLERVIRDPDSPQHAMDITGNFIHSIMDDCIETDYLFTNIRVMRNRVMNALVGISVQPSYSGPIYLIRNVGSNFSYTPWKLHSGVTGVLMYHNTTLSYNAGIEQHPPTLRNSRFRNNILLGTRFYGASWSQQPEETPHNFFRQIGPAKPNTMDYNAYRHVRPRGDEPRPLIRWTVDGGESWREFMTLDEFREASGQERHGMVVEAEDLFAGPFMFDWEARDYRPEEMDLRLKPGAAAVDAGVRLPNVNDGFTGEAPDLGAYERDRPPPLYGPRPLRDGPAPANRH